MLRDIVEGIVSDTNDVVIAGDVAGSGAAVALRQTGANLVISGRDDKQLVRELLAQEPAIDVLTVTDEGRTGTLHRLVPRRIALGELSPDRLLDIIRRTPLGRCEERANQT